MSKKLSLVRSSPYSDGKIINVLLTEFTVNNKDYGHYVLIESMTFLRKRYMNPNNGKVSYSNSVFCKICFEHFRSENTLKEHEKFVGKRRTQKIFRVAINRFITLIMNIISKEFLLDMPTLKAF